MKTYIEIQPDEILNESEEIKETIHLEEAETIFEAEDEEEEKYGKQFAQLMIIWIIQQCLMTAFQCEFAAAPGQETFDIQADDKVKEKFDRLATILDAVKEEDFASFKVIAEGNDSGSAVDNAKYAQELIEACPKEHGDEIKEILGELKDYLGNQVAAFKLN